MKTKRILPLALATLFTLLLLAGCGGGKVPEGMDTTRLETDAKAMVDAINARDYETAAALLPAGSSSPEALQAGIEATLDALGPFEGYKSTSYLTADDDTYGTLANVLLECQYQNQKVVWRVVVTTDYQIIGIWM